MYRKGKRGDIALTLLHRPNINSINSEVLAELSYAFKDIQHDNKTRAVLISAKGDIFSAGVDLKWVARGGKKKLIEIIEIGQEVFNTLENLSIPTIAVIDGKCIGGGLELALSCDIRIAGEKALFMLPEVKLGIIPGWGANTRLPHIVGIENANKMIFTGKYISARDALKINLVTTIFPSSTLIDDSVNYIEHITESSPIAIYHTKKILNSQNNDHIKDGLRRDIKAEKVCFKTKDVRRAMRSFLFKKKPKFKGN